MIRSWSGLGIRPLGTHVYDDKTSPVSATKEPRTEVLPEVEIYFHLMVLSRIVRQARSNATATPGLLPQCVNSATLLIQRLATFSRCHGPNFISMSIKRTHTFRSRTPQGPQFHQTVRSTTHHLQTCTDKRNTQYRSSMSFKRSNINIPCFQQQFEPNLADNFCTNFVQFDLGVWLLDSLCNPNGR